MVVNRNFVIVEDIVQIKEILDRAEYLWIDETMSSEESLKVSVPMIGLKVVVHHCHIEVFLSIVELVNVVFDVPVWESMSNE